MVPAVSRDFAATFPLVRFPNPRRTDARRSGLACIRTPQESPFLRRPEAVHPGAAGVSRPWFLETSSQWLDRNCRAEASGRWCVHEHRCNCVTIPRRADARRSYGRTWCSTDVVIFRPGAASHSKSGRREPTVASPTRLQEICGISRTTFECPDPRRADARRSFSACVCTSQKSFFRRQPFAQQFKSGGRKPPRGFATATAPAFVSMVPAVSRESAATFPLVSFPNPRLTDARRSFSACVCTLQKSFFRRQPFAQQFKSGGRKPPVGSLPLLHRRS
jgi:hypothetical protein